MSTILLANPRTQDTNRSKGKQTNKTETRFPFFLTSTNTFSIWTGMNQKPVTVTPRAHTQVQLIFCTQCSALLGSTHFRMKLFSKSCVWHLSFWHLGGRGKRIANPRTLWENSNRSYACAEHGDMFFSCHCPLDYGVQWLLSQHRLCVRHYKSSWSYLKYTEGCP